MQPCMGDRPLNGYSGSWDAGREGEPPGEPRLGRSLALPGRTIVNTHLAPPAIDCGPVRARAACRMCHAPHSAEQPRRAKERREPVEK